MSKGIIVDNYLISVQGRRLVIERADMNGPINIVFDPDQASLLAALLNKLAADDHGVRSDFRIPISADLGLETVLLHDGNDWAVNTTSLSLSGVYAETDSPLKAKVGTLCSLQLRFEDHFVEMDAVITRSLPTGFAAAFTCDEPSNEHSRLFMALQRKWIAVRSVPDPMSSGRE